MPCSISISQVKQLEESATGANRGERNYRRPVAGRWRVDTWRPWSSSLRIAFFISLWLLHASSAVGVDKLQFSETDLDDVREGYFTLSWNACPSAAEYQLTAADGHAVYRGPLAKAFVSGLADGTYEYHVEALDIRGQVIATSAIPVVIEVKHWSLRLALGLLTCGLVVFLVVVGLIVKGALQTRSQPTLPRSLSGECK